MHFISGTVEGNDTRAVMWECYQLERTSIPLWSHYSDGTKLQLEDVLSQVIDVVSHPLGPLPPALWAADWLFRNTKEGTPVSAITTLSEAFGIEGFTISISWSWILKQWWEFKIGHSKEMNGWHQMLETGVRGKSYMPLWITNAIDLLPRIALSVNISLPIWRSSRTDIPSCPCWQIWVQGCDDLFRWHRYFCNVTHVSIPDKCSFNQTIWT